MNALDIDISLLSDLQLLSLTQRIEAVRRTREMFWDAVGGAISERQLASLTVTTLLQLRRYVEEAITAKAGRPAVEEELTCPPENN